ncbi:MAG TPA: flavin reductase [Propionibacteriaceae bacterium]|nr:flavin reductase [Propionibacteriaceae bacterium]
MPDHGEVTVGAAMRTAFRGHGTSVAIATTSSDGRPAGVLVSSLVSVSVAPPVVMVSLSDSSFAAQEVLRGSRFAIHMLTGGDRELADWFARPRPAAEEPPWTLDGSGVPLLDTLGPVLFGTVGDRVRAGSATVVFVTVDHVEPARVHDPMALVHVDRNWHLVPRDAAD